MRLVRNGKWDWWETESEIGLERDREWDWFVIFGRLVCSKVRQWDREIVNKTSTQHELIYRDWEPKSDTRPVTQVLQVTTLHNKTKTTSYNITKVLYKTRDTNNKTHKYYKSDTTLRDTNNTRPTGDTKTRDTRIQDHKTIDTPWYFHSQCSPTSHLLDLKQRVNGNHQYSNKNHF